MRRIKLYIVLSLIALIYLCFFIIGYFLAHAYYDNHSMISPLVSVVEAAEPSIIDNSPRTKILHAWGAVEGNRAIKVAFCESSLDPDKKSSQSSAAGLFQILKGTWKDNDCSGNPYNSDDNIACAYKIYQRYGWNATASWHESFACWKK